MNERSPLALLSRDDNGVLSNSVFEVKRRPVIALDPKGSYIPVCTRNLFAKYYEAGVGSKHLHFWGPLDREAHLEAIREVLAPYLLEDVSENDKVEDTDEDAA